MLNIVIAALATWQAVEIYHHGSIFEDLRAWFEAKQSGTSNVLAFVAELQACPFCLSVWVGSIALAFQFSPLWPLTASLAVSRLANLANDLTKVATRETADEE